MSSDRPRRLYLLAALATILTFFVTTAWIAYQAGCGRPRESAEKPGVAEPQLKPAEGMRREVSPRSDGEASPEGTADGDEHPREEAPRGIVDLTVGERVGVRPGVVVVVEEIRCGVSDAADTAVISVEGVGSSESRALRPGEAAVVNGVHLSVVSIEGENVELTVGR